MREKFFVKDSARHSVLILGLGIHGGGVGAARFFAHLGMRVLVTDLKTKKELSSSLRVLKGLPITYVFGKHRMEDIEQADLIIKNPGVPDSSIYIKKAKKLKIPITNDGALFFALAPREHVIAITGTKGKTTTALLTKHLLGSNAISIGTPGISFFDYFYTKKEPQWVVAEFSSFDLECIKNTAHIAVITSLFPDHLNRYHSFDAYAKTKMRLFTFQEKGDIAFLWQSPTIKKYATLSKLKSKIIWINNIPIQKNISWRVAPEAIAIATSIAKHIGIPSATISARLSKFDAPPGRLEIVAKKNNCTFINDTTATNPGSAIHSLSMLVEKFSPAQNITIITGGEDKKFPRVDIKNYARAINKYRVNIIILPGSFSDMLTPLLKNYQRARSMSDAIKKATTIKSGIVALVPGAASFNSYKNEFDRAKHFIRAIQTIKSL